MVCSISASGPTRPTSGGRYTGPARADVAAAASKEPEGPARLTIVTPTYQKVLVHVNDVPGFGWSRWDFDPLTVTAVEVTEGENEHVVVPNGVVTVAVDPADGTF